MNYASPPPQFDPIEMIYRLRRAGWTLIRIAKEVGLARATVSLSIYSGANPKVRQKVAEILKTSEEALWPFRFHLEADSLALEKNINSGNPNKEKDEYE